MAITSTSDPDEIAAQYLANVGYARTGSVQSCNLFIEALLAMIGVQPARWTKGQHALEYKPELWLQLLDRAQVWRNGQPTTAGGNGSVRHLSFGEDFR